MSSKKTATSVSRGAGQRRSLSTPRAASQREGGDERTWLLSSKSTPIRKQLQKQYQEQQRLSRRKSGELQQTKTPSPKVQNKKHSKKIASPPNSKNKKEKNSVKKTKRPSLAESLEKVTRQSLNNNQTDGAPPLPQRGWFSATDPNTKIRYYYHSVTRETQWEKPKDYDKETMAYYEDLKKYTRYHRKQLIHRNSIADMRSRSNPSSSSRGISTRKTKSFSNSKSPKQQQQSNKVDVTASDKYTSLSPSDRYIPVIPQERDVIEALRELDDFEEGTRLSNLTNTPEKLFGPQSTELDHHTNHVYHPRDIDMSTVSQSIPPPPPPSSPQDLEQYDNYGNVLTRYAVDADEDDDSVITGTRTSARNSIYPDDDDFLPLDIVDDPSVIDEFFFEGASAHDNSIMDAGSLDSSITPYSHVRADIQGRFNMNDFGERAVAGCQAPCSTEVWSKRVSKKSLSLSNHHNITPPHYIDNKQNYKKQGEHQRYRRSHSEPRLRSGDICEI